MSIEYISFKNDTIEINLLNHDFWHKMFDGASKNCVVLNFCGFYCNPLISQDFQFLDNLKSQLDNKLLIVDLISDPYIEYPDYIDSVKNIKKYCPEAIFLTGDFKHQHDEYVFYPGWFYNQKKNCKNFSEHILSATNVQRKYYLSSLNRRPMPHRCFIISKLYKNNYINELNYITFYHKDPYNHSPISANDWYISAMPDPTRQDFIDLIPKLPFNPDVNFQGNNDWSSIHPAFVDSYLNIVTETEVECRWFSEKVTKPLSTGQIFLLAGGAGSVNDLRNLGFDMFDDIIDHSYDNIEFWPDRLNAMLDVVYSIKNYNWEHIYKDTLNRRLNNVKWFFSEEFENNVRKNFLNLFK